MWILTEAGIEFPRPDDGTIGSHVGDVASDTESNPPVPSHQRSLNLRARDRPAHAASSGGP